MRLFHDVRFAFRGFRRNPGVTLVTVIVLALGIGANTAIFSVVDALVLRPLPFPRPDELVAIPDGVMYLDFVDLRAQARSFRDLAVYRLDRSLVTAPGEPEIVNAVSASAALFSVLGVEPQLGRTFVAGEDQPGGGRVAVVSHGFWQKRLGGNAAALGSRFSLDGLTVTVIGVMPSGFRFPLDDDQADLWISQGGEFRDLRQWRGYRSFRSIGRLKPGVDGRQAAAEVAMIGARLAQLYPKENAGRTISIAPYDRTVKAGRVAFLIVLAAVAVVLLVACANAANLQLVRASARRREMAIRVALGAGRGTIIWQFVTEGLVLAFLAGGLGLAAAVGALDVLVALLPRDLPRVHAIGLDWRVLLYTLGAALGTALLVGFTPALQVSRSQLLDSLKSGDRGTTGHRTLRGILLVAEISLAVVLLAGAGLLVRSFARVVAVDPGFDARSLLTARIQIPRGNNLGELFPELLRRLRALPEVTGATFVREMPYGHSFNSWNFTLEDRPAPPAENPWWANARGVGEGYFPTLGIPVRQGRDFLPEDFVEPAKTAVINEAFARQYWPQASALGHRIRAYERDVMIVGVVGDTRGSCDQSGCSGSGAGRLDRPPVPEVYIPNRAFALAYLVLRTSSSRPAALIRPLRATVQELNPGALFSEVRPMEDAIDESLDQRRLVMSLLGAFAILAIVLAALGIYGVISYSVTQRTREIGVRMALGATGSTVRRMVVMQGLRLCLVGLAIGVVAALGLTRLLASQLFGVSSADPITYVALAALILLVSALGSFVPALRATRVDPMIALRSD